MSVVGVEFGLAHRGELQLAARLVKSRSIGIIGNLPGVEEVDPLLQRHFRTAVEVVHLQDVVFGIEFAHLAHVELLLLEWRQRQHLSVVYAPKLRLAMIHDVRAIAEIEVDDVDAVNLAHVLVAFAPVDVFGDEFGGAEEHPLEIGKLRLVLHFDEEELPRFVFSEHVHAVLLVVDALLVALALQQLLDFDGLAEQRGDESLKHAIVGLVAQEALHGPVKSDILSLYFHSAYYINRWQ